MVIPCRNARRWLPAQLEALFRQVGAPGFEILVVDNGSTDETRDIAQAACGPVLVRVIEAPEEAGLSHARNAGVTAARTELVLFCDADDVVAPDWVAELHRAFEETSAGIVGGRLDVHTANSPDVLRAYGYPERPEPGTAGTQPVIRRDLPPFAGYLPSIGGANFAVRRTDYLAVGGMDRTYRGGSEETDFQWRVMENGGTMVTTSAATVAYRLRDTWRGIFQQQRRYQLNRVLLWMRFRDRGMSGPSAKYSLLALSRALLDTLQPGAEATARLESAYRLGGHLGALQGILRYRVLGRVPARRLMATPSE